jgi:hypothetical protein
MLPIEKANGYRDAPKALMENNRQTGNARKGRSIGMSETFFPKFTYSS